MLRPKKQPDTEHSSHGPAGPMATNFTAESLALRMALHEFEERKKTDEALTQCVICSDSLSGLETLEQP